MTSAASLRALLTERYHRGQSRLTALSLVTRLLEAPEMSLLCARVLAPGPGISQVDRSLWSKLLNQYTQVMQTLVMP